MPGRVNVTRKWLSEGAAITYFEDHSVTLQELPNTPVLFLVGDSGSGKTDSIKTLIKSAPTQRTLRSFADVTSPDDVRRWIAECYKNGSELFIDAYDERSGKYRRRFLLEPLDEAQAANTCPQIRIVSRDAHLDRKLVEEVEERVGRGPDGSIVYRLMPLEEAQIRAWVEERLGDEEAGFFQEVSKNQLEPYLGRPTDLEAFIGLFRKTRSLGKSPTEAWSAAILQEVSEPNPDRLDVQTDISAKVDAADRYRVAQIWAVAQEICGIPAIVLDGVTQLETQNQAASVDSLWQQVHLLFPQENKAFFKEAIIETAQSRLFELGKDGVRLASAAKAQFLAAQFLTAGDRSQIINLFKDRYEGKRIPERAQPIAAEIAKFDKPLFDWLCSNQPDALLRGVVLDYSAERRAQLTEALLASSDNRTPWAAYGRSLSALLHPGLSNQLRPYLKGQIGNSKDLNLAIDIAEHTRCSEVADELATVVNDSKEELETRVNAALALARMGPQVAESLRPLLQVPQAVDKYDELYGAAMMALWPQGFTPEGAFDVLREPQQVSGIYHGFLSYYSDGPSRRLTKELLKPGLRWLVIQERRDRSYRHDFDKLSWALVKMAWETIDSPDVADLLAQVVQSRVDRHAGRALPFREKPFYPGLELPTGLDAEEFFDSSEKRFKLFKAWLRLSVPNRSWFDAFMLIRDTDLEDLITLAKESVGETLKILSQVVTSITCNLIREKQESRIRALRPALSLLGIEVSILRKEMRAFQRTQRRYRPPQRKAGFENDFHSAEIDRVLKTGDENQFPYLLDMLTFDANGWQVGNGYQISEWSRWNELHEEQRSEFVLIAKKFLKLGPSTPRPTNESLSSWDRSGLLSLFAVAEADLDWLRCNTSTAKAWLPLLATICNLAGMQGHSAMSLFCMLTDDEVVEEIRAQLELRASDGSDPIHVDRFDALWRPDLGESLGQLSRSWRTSSRQRLLAILRQQQHPASTTEIRLELKSRRAARLRFAMRLVVEFGIDELYGDLANVARKNEDALDELWHLLWNGSRIDRGDSVGRFGFEVLKRLFLRAVEEAPPENDIEFRAGPVSPTYTRQRLRDNFAAAIAKDLAVDAQEFVSDWARKERLGWMKDVALKARQDWLEQSWSPPSLSSVVKLKVGKCNRFIATQRDLREAVGRVLEIVRPDFESLDLNWRDAAKGKPALEEAITKNLAKWLEPRLDGLVVNAEVSCREGRTDIQVEANVEDGSGNPYRLKCIIEAKRCLNPRLQTGIPNQLIKKYLRGRGGESGIYLVLWFGHLSNCTNCSKKGVVQQQLQSQADKSNYDICVTHFDMRNPSSKQRRKR